MKILILPIIVAIGTCILQASFGQDFTVRLTTRTNTYIVGEPVVVDATVEFTGTNSLTVNNPLDKGVYLERFEIANSADGNFTNYMTSEEAHDALIDRTALPPISFSPHAKRMLHYAVLGKHSPGRDNLTSLVIPVAGAYDIRFVVSYRGKEFNAATHVKVVDPQNDEDKAAWATIQREGLLPSYCATESLPKDEVLRKQRAAKLDSLLTRFPNSTYSKTINKRLTEQ